MKFPQLFAILKKKRDFERAHLPFIASLLDFDLIVEIGYAQEQKKKITPKQLFLLKLGSVSSVRRRLTKLTVEGIVVRQPNSSDQRSEFLTLSAASVRVLERYGGLLISLSEFSD